MRVFLHRGAAALALLVLVALAPSPARAGVTNPDISAIGQPFMRWTDDPSDPSRKRFVLDPGEVEFMFDAALNPYARGTIVASLGAEEAGIEEAFFIMNRGLPLGLQLKGGKYRVGFGKLNPVHPHAYPFPDRFHVLSSFLPGDESFNETAVQLSEQLALSEKASITIYGDYLQGDSFRIPREDSGALNDPFASGGDDGAGEARPAALGRLSSFFQVGEQSGLEVGLSATQGTNNVAAGTHTAVYGADVKAKLWNSPRSYLVLQSEVLSADREIAGWDEPSAAYTSTSTKPAGGYLFADYNFKLRYNVGASFERWQEPDADRPWNQAVGAFAGIALMEETTVFRIAVEHLQPATPAGGPEPDAINTVTLTVVFSMGPHKAHQF